MRLPAAFFMGVIHCAASVHSLGLNGLASGHGVLCRQCRHRHMPMAAGARQVGIVADQQHSAAQLRGTLTQDLHGVALGNGSSREVGSSAKRKAGCSCMRRRVIPPFSTDVRSRRVMQRWPSAASGSIHPRPCAGGRDCRTRSIAWRAPEPRQSLTSDSVKATRSEPSG